MSSATGSEAGSSGKFYIDLPAWLGGTHVCFFDLSPQAELLSWGRLILKCILWIGFGMFILKQFDVKFQI